MTTKTTKPNDGGPFHRQGPEMFNSLGEPYRHSMSGISLRAWLAGMTMNGMASVTEYDFSDPNVTEVFAKQSVSMADALIAELEKQP